MDAMTDTGVSVARTLRLSKNGKSFIVTVDGDVRTVLSSQPSLLSADTDYTFCTVTDLSESLNGIVYVQTGGGSCIPVRNPSVDLTGYETLVDSSRVLSLPAFSSNQFYPIDIDQVRSDEYLLMVDLSDTKCDMLPEIMNHNDSPIFGKLPNGTWLLFDPHLDFQTNTPENPLPDGGSKALLDTFGVTLCSNVARTVVNEDQCQVSSVPNACWPSFPQSFDVVLNEKNIRQLYNLTGLYIYAIQGLAVIDNFSNALQHPCTPGLRSRWSLSSGSVCEPTVLQPKTSLVLATLLQDSTDTNAFIRDITFPLNGVSCDKVDTNPEIEILVDGNCWIRVHPDYLSVYDVSL